MKKKEAKEVYTLADLRTWQGSDAQPPVKLGVLGDPVAHSISPQMQNAALQQLKVDAQYARFQIAPNELGEALELMCKQEFVGCNLTVPHKIAAAQLVDSVDASAQRIGAINTIAFREGKLRGFNTDGVGFARAIRSEFQVDLRDLRVLLLGAGGAARAIAVQCANAQCERLAIANRHFEKAQELVKQLQPDFSGPRVLGPVARLEAVGWDEAAFRFQIANSDLVVNATPLGLQAHDTSILSETLLAPHLMVYDTVYAKTRTPLVTAAMEAGARATDGRTMLLQQGAAAFEIWFGREAPIETMRAALVAA